MKIKHDKEHFLSCNVAAFTYCDGCEVFNQLKLAEYDRDGSHIIVHCLHGNNRSRTVVEAFHFTKLGFHFEDEYKGFTNHLVWNCASGYLPPLQEMEKLLSDIAQNCK